MTFVHFYDGETWKIPDTETGRPVIVKHSEGDVFLYALLKPAIKERLSKGFKEHLESVAWQVENVESWMGILYLQKATEDDCTIIREVVANLKNNSVSEKLEAGRIREKAYQHLVGNV